MLWRNRENQIQDHPHSSDAVQQKSCMASNPLEKGTQESDKGMHTCRGRSEPSKHSSWVLFVLLQQTNVRLVYLLASKEPQAGQDFLAWLQRKPPDLQKRGDWLLLRGMQHDGDAAHDAQNAPQDAKYIQALLEHQVGQHRAADAAHLIAR